MQFNSAFAVSFHSTTSVDAQVKSDSGVIFLGQIYHNSLLCIAISEIASFCIY